MAWVCCRVGILCLLCRAMYEYLLIHGNGLFIDIMAWIVIFILSHMGEYLLIHHHAIAGAVSCGQHRVNGYLWEWRIMRL